MKFGLDGERKTVNMYDKSIRKSCIKLEQIMLIF